MTPESIPGLSFPPELAELLALPPLAELPLPELPVMVDLHEAA